MCADSSITHVPKFALSQRISKNNLTHSLKREPAFLTMTDGDKPDEIFLIDSLMTNVVLAFNVTSKALYLKKVIPYVHLQVSTRVYFAAMDALFVAAECNETINIVVLSFTRINTSEWSQSGHCELIFETKWVGAPILRVLSDGRLVCSKMGNSI